ncbi:chymotrypsinogen A-like isoform X3 [Amblyomma americanum]
MCVLSWFCSRVMSNLTLALRVRSAVFLSALVLLLHVASRGARVLTASMPAALTSSRTAENVGPCGRPSVEPQLEPEDRIIGGQPAVPGSWPWHAALHKHGTGHACGGALITDRHIITAAHCVWSDQPGQQYIKVHLGGHNRDFRQGSEIWEEVEEICAHSSFKYHRKSSFKGDIAILKLKNKINFTNMVHPVCLPVSYEELGDGSHLYVTGWGRTGHLLGSAEPAALCRRVADVLDKSVKMGDDRQLSFGAELKPASADKTKISVIPENPPLS